METTSIVWVFFFQSSNYEIHTHGIKQSVGPPSQPPVSVLHMGQTELGPRPQHLPFLGRCPESLAY